MRLKAFMLFLAVIFGAIAFSGAAFAAPTVDAGADVTVEEGQAVTLTATPTLDPGRTVTNYEWKDGAITLASGATASTYGPATLAPGTHSIVLTITDSAGEKAQDTVVVTVKAKTAKITVIVKDADTKLEVAGAEARVDSFSFYETKTTDNFGEARFEGVPAECLFVKVTKSGYESSEKANICPSAGQNLRETLFIARTGIKRALEIVSTSYASTIFAGESTPITVSVRNAGDEIEPNIRVYVTIGTSRANTELFDLGRGQTVEKTLFVSTPTTRGTYALEIKVIGDHATQSIVRVVNVFERTAVSTAPTGSIPGEQVAKPAQPVETFAPITPPPAPTSAPTTPTTQPTPPQPTKPAQALVTVSATDIDAARFRGDFISVTIVNNLGYDELFEVSTTLPSAWAFPPTPQIVKNGETKTLNVYIAPTEMGRFEGNITVKGGNKVVSEQPISVFVGEPSATKIGAPAVAAPVLIGDVSLLGYTFLGILFAGVLVYLILRTSGYELKFRFQDFRDFMQKIFRYGRGPRGPRKPLEPLTMPLVRTGNGLRVTQKADDSQSFSTSWDRVIS